MIYVTIIKTESTMEIERKFKIKYLPDLSFAIEKNISQWYISYFPEKRIRLVNGKYIITEKSLGTLTREETEYNAEENLAKHLISECKRIPVEKTRYIFNIDSLTAELDIYKGSLSGLTVCEFEFSSVKDAENAVLPEWVGDEITHDQSYKNASLSKKINGELYKY